LGGCPPELKPKGSIGKPPFLERRTVNLQSRERGDSWVNTGVAQENIIVRVVDTAGSVQKKKKGTWNGWDCTLNRWGLTEDFQKAARLTRTAGGRLRAA